METQTFSYAGGAWATEPDGALDSERTPVVLVTRARSNVLYELDGKPALQLYKEYLGERAEEETEATLEMLPRDTRQVGFCSYGEISPCASGHCDLHNQTMTLTAIGEA
jgi:hypothetical protein